MAPLVPLYLGLTRVAPGLLARRARAEHARQGADPARLCERLGRATLPAPDKPPVWLHAASVGEVKSVLPLARALAKRHPLLFTTTTATGAETVAAGLPEALHQFQPIDTGPAVTAFLDHWRPRAAIFTEADLWPRMVAALRARSIPSALVNARASKSRARSPRLARWMLDRLDLVTAQSDAVAEDIAALTDTTVQSPGDLKRDLAAPVADEDIAHVIREAAGERPVWAALSTHEGEESAIIDAQARLAADGCDALLLLAPRHPDRAGDLSATIAARGMAHARRSAGALPGLEDPVFLFDTMGELGTAIAASDVVFMGGSLVDKGGHTPLEPALLGRGSLHGPHIDNFAQAYADLALAGAARRVGSAEALATTLRPLLQDVEARAAFNAPAAQVAAAGRGATQRTLDLLEPLIGGPGR